jgi:dihydroorotase
MLGLETALAVTLASLATMSVVDVLALLSWRPARIAGLSVAQGGDQGGPVAVGRPGNLCVIDPAERWEVDPCRLSSRSRNTPWAGKTLTGRVRHTVFRGEPVVVDTEARR